MPRPGNKRLMEAKYVKVQPNKTGTSFMQVQSVYYRTGTTCLVDGTCNQQGKILKKGIYNNKIMLQTPESIRKNIRESNRTAILLRKEFDV